ncbi:cytochrome P450 [Dactylosporangium sp. NPDC005572]|uniref:cytochrome P450 n=1 Tax=Dactylosporangium sp. NPDC005572 TaxID=3156889 RepID=UPI0033AB6F5F
MVSHSFTAKRIADWVPRIEEIVHDCLDAMATQGPPADLATAFGQEIPSRVLCELIGIPEEDRKELQMRANLAFDQTLDRGRLIDHFVGLRDWVADLVVQKRNSPDNTMFGALVRDYGHELTDTEITGMVALILVAGQDSTAGALNIGTLLLLRHPDQLAVVRDDPTITEQAVEELLRYITVTQTGLVRTATEDLELGGEQIKKGDYVMMSFSQANRDETVYQDANVFDVHREREPHLAFGHGIHFCLGAPLARKELAIGIPALLRRFPDLKLAIPFEEVPFREFATVYGVESLPVTW